MDKYYSILQAAKELGKSRPTVYKMIRDGKLKAEVVAGRPAITVKEVEKVKNADSGRTQTTAT